MGKFVKRFFQLCGIIMVAFPCCLLAGCLGPLAISVTWTQANRIRVETIAPGNSMRVVSDDPTTVSLSPGGNYMFRHYDHHYKPTDPVPWSLIENISTGGITSISNTIKYGAWISDTTFFAPPFLDLPHKCLYEVSNPTACNEHVLDVQNDYKYVIDHSQQIIVGSIPVYSYIYGRGKTVAQKSIASIASCQETCREQLKSETDNNATTVTIRPDPRTGEADFSPNGEYYAIYKSRRSPNRLGLGCLRIYASNTQTEVTNVCEYLFFPFDDFDPIGWNHEGTAYYFQAHLSENGGAFNSYEERYARDGDVFILPVVRYSLLWFFVSMFMSVAIGVVSGRLSQATGRPWTVITSVTIIGIISLLMLEVTGQVGVKIIGMAYIVIARMFSRAIIYGVIGGSILGVLVKKVGSKMG